VVITQNGFVTIVAITPAKNDALEYPKISFYLIFNKFLNNSYLFYINLIPIIETAI
jgi:hypothetical protein